MSHNAFWSSLPHLTDLGHPNLFCRRTRKSWHNRYADTESRDYD